MQCMCVLICSNMPDAVLEFLTLPDVVRPTSRNLFMTPALERLSANFVDLYDIHYGTR